MTQPSPSPSRATPRRSPGETRDALMEAAFGLVRRQGLTATSVDEICAAAGVSKGALFHHFKSKDELAAAAGYHWSAVTEPFFEAAPYHAPVDPLARVLGYIDLRAEMMAGETPFCDPKGFAAERFLGPLADGHVLKRAVHALPPARGVAD